MGGAVMLGKARVGALALFVAAAAVVGLLVLRDDDDPVAATDRGPGATVDQDAARNGSIIHTGDGSGSAQELPPELTGAAPYPAWKAFDPRTESFLFLSGSGRVSVVDRDGSTPVFDCDHPEPACELITFGPGPGEVTVPVDDPGGLNLLQSVQIMARDGTVRDKLDLRTAVTATGEPELLEDLAWSPDGSRLAVSLVPSWECDPDRLPCEGRVWIFDRDGAEPRLVYSERGPEDQLDGPYPYLVAPESLMWSPRGDRLGFVVSGRKLFRDLTPRLVAVEPPAADRPADEPPVANTLHVYDEQLVDAELSEDYEAFAFAWSPDGTRIAVTTENGIAELSAEDGRRLARHRGGKVRGPLAWLRER